MRGGSTDQDKDEEEELATILKLRVMKIFLNFQINEVPGVLCFYLVNICLMFLILCISILMLQFNSSHL